MQLVEVCLVGLLSGSANQARGARRAWQRNDGLRLGKSVKQIHRQTIQARAQVFNQVGRRARGWAAAAPAIEQHRLNQFARGNLVFKKLAGLCGLHAVRGRKTFDFRQQSLLARGVFDRLVRLPFGAGDFVADAQTFDNRMQQGIQRRVDGCAGPGPCGAEQNEQ